MAMDWGTLIPLWFFLRLNRLESRIVIVTPSRDIPLEQNLMFGKKVAEVGETSEKRVAFVASADRPTPTTLKARTASRPKHASTTGQS
jgi:aromatic ring-opening dioxygenase LigB subunit